ncbi:MAG: hypothetical protein WCR54_06315 [Clostridia bacterium]
MIQNKENMDLYLALKNDDLATFDAIIEQKRGNLSLCFGRFPILSICYLYKSKKIIASYEKKLAKIKTYIIIDEEFDLYEIFKKKAKRTLRLYVYEDRLVTPPEMLAIIGELRYLESNYSTLFENEQTTNNLKQICRLQYSSNIIVEDFGIIFPKQPLSTKQKKIFKLTAILALAFIVIFVSIGLGFLGVMGLGTISNPIKINSEKQLEMALNNKNSRYYKLTKDINYNGSMVENFVGDLDGNDKKITITSPNTIINNLTGNIENVNFVITDIERTIENNGALIINNSTGIIDNVDLEISGKLNEDNEEATLIFSAFVGENSGKITNCNALINIEYLGNGTGDASFSTIVGTNNGEVNNCTIKENSVIITDTIDVAGIAIHNEESGKIYDCINNASITQNSNCLLWNPNTSGIVIANVGAVKNCVNNGTIISTTTADTNEISVFGSGIACTNIGVIEKSKNVGEIKVNSENSIIYAGGVVAYNSTRESYLENDSNFGQITVQTNNETKIFVFAGGIAGFSAGAIVNCFADTNIVTTNTIDGDTRMTWLGGIIGIQNVTGLGEYIDNNYYVKKDNMLFGIASQLSNNVIFIGIDTNCNGLESLEKLKEKGVYWE